MNKKGRDAAFKEPPLELATNVLPLRPPPRCTAARCFQGETHPLVAGCYFRTRTSARKDCCNCSVCRKTSSKSDKSKGLTRGCEKLSTILHQLICVTDALHRSSGSSAGELSLRRRSLSLTKGI